MLQGSEYGYAYLISPHQRRDGSVVWHWAVTRERDFVTVPSGQSLSEAGAKEDALKAIRSQSRQASSFPALTQAPGPCPHKTPRAEEPPPVV